MTVGLPATRGASEQWTASPPLARARYIDEMHEVTCMSVDACCVRSLPTPRARPPACRAGAQLPSQRASACYMRMHLLLNPTSRLAAAGACCGNNTLSNTNPCLPACLPPQRSLRAAPPSLALVQRELGLEPVQPHRFVRLVVKLNPLQLCRRSARPRARRTAAVQHWPSFAAPQHAPRERSTTHAIPAASHL